MIKKLLPHLIATAVFLIVSLFYFAPQYQGKDVKQYDNIQANGTRASIERHIAQYGEHPQWIDNMFGGMPSYSFDMESHSGKFFDPLVGLFNFMGRPASHYFLLMMGFYFMALCFSINPYIAITGALAWGLSSYFYIIYVAGHIMKLVALIYVAPLIGSIWLAYKKNLLLGGALAALFAALEIKSVHPQITYYFLFVIAGLVATLGVYAFKAKQLRSFLLKSAALAGFALLAVGANLVYLYYTNDYTKESTRGRPILVSQTGKEEKGLDRDYITAWSYGKTETFNLLVPNLMGGTSHGGFSQEGEVYNELKKYNAGNLVEQIPAYWGPQPMTSGPVYIGAVVIFIFVLGLFLIRGAFFWWLIPVTILSILLAWGKNMMWLTDLFIDYFPLYNKFRTVSMILVIAEFTIPVFAMATLQQLFSATIDPKKVIRSVRNSAAIVGGILLLFIIFGSTLFSFSGDTDQQLGLPEDILKAMQIERISLLQQDAWRSFFFVLATAGFLWWMAIKSAVPRYRKAWLWLIPAVLVIADMTPINLRYFNHDHFVTKKEATEIPMTEIDKAILQDTTNYRVANMSVSIFNDATTSKYHRSIGGYSAVKPRRYQDIIDYYLAKGNMNIYNLLNTKYFIVSDDKGNQNIQVNPNAFGSAWLVDSVVWVNTPNEEIEALNKTELEHVAVVGREFENRFELPVADSSATVTQDLYRANQWEFTTHSNTPQLLVLSEMYFPNGWKLTVNGKETAPIRADYLLFGVPLAAGENKIVFRFDPPYLGAIDAVALCCSLLIVLSLLTGIYITVRKHKKS